VNKSRKAYVYVRIHDGGAIMRQPRADARMLVEGLKTCSYANRRDGRAFEKAEAANIAALVRNILNPKED
jgi:hypothetical protein